MNLTKNEMIAALTRASDSYYNRSTSIMTDEQFDDLKDQFEALYPNDPFLKTIGASIPEDSHWEKATHKIPMASLNKVKTKGEFTQYFKTQNFFCISEKLDGISIAVDYVDGDFTRAVTRGDGVVGEDITRNVRNMQGVPDVLKIVNAVSLRGEIIMTADDFDAVNEVRRVRGQKLFENMRNAASGIAKKISGEYSEFLTVRFYNVTGLEFLFQTRGEMFVYLESALKLQTPFVGHSALPSEVMGHVKFYEDSHRAILPYDIDGLVIEVDPIPEYESMGLKSHNPAGAVAWKFGSLTSETTLLDVEWSLGNSGTITPVAILEPVRLGGVTVKRASLANIDLFMKFKFRIGDTVEVSRRNDVIPKVEKIISRNDGGFLLAPTSCPSCGGSTSIQGKFLVCNNPDCEGKVIGNLKKWAEKVGMKSLGLGEKTIEKLYDAGLVTYPSDFYLLKKGDMLRLDGFGGRKAEIVLDVISSRKELTLQEFIGGLNIKNWGRRMTDLLVENGYDTLDLLQNISVGELITIKGIEEKTAFGFVVGLDLKADLIGKLLVVGVIIKETETVEVAPNAIFGGMSFVFTGAIQKIDDDGKRFKRSDMQHLVVENGGENKSSVSKGLTYLVQADPTSQSSKTKKAESCDVEILSEAKFFEMLGT